MTALLNRVAALRQGLQDVLGIELGPEEAQALADHIEGLQFAPAEIVIGLHGVRRDGPHGHVKPMGIMSTGLRPDGTARIVSPVGGVEDVDPSILFADRRRFPL